MGDDDIPMWFPIDRHAPDVFRPARCAAGCDAQGTSCAGESEGEGVEEWRADNVGCRGGVDWGQRGQYMSSIESGVVSEG